VDIFGLKDIFNLNVTDEKAWNPALWNFKGSQTESGESVNEYSALNYSAVYNATSLISGTVSTLPLNLKRKSGRNTLTVDSNPLHSVLHDQANPYMTAMTMREVSMGHVLLWGNSYAEIVRNPMGQVVELWPITPNRVQVKLFNGEMVYIIKMTNGEDVVLPRDKILHIPGMGFDGYVGYSLVSLAANAIGLGLAMETFGSRYFGNGTHPGVIATHPGKLSPEAAERLQKSLVSAYSGLSKSHRLMLLEEGMTLDKVTIPPNDSQFLESRQFQVPEIARWFNLPPHKLKDLTKSSFSNIEAEQISFVTDSILPWLVRLEQNYRMQLLNALEKKQGLYLKHNVDGLLRGNAKDRALLYRTMWMMGSISQNEIREKEDMDPIKGGDEYFVPLNMQPLSRALQEPEPVRLPADSPPDDGEEIKAIPSQIPLIPQGGDDPGARKGSNGKGEVNNES
jgi:HK97 family phage portal protein